MREIAALSGIHYDRYRQRTDRGLSIVVHRSEEWTGYCIIKGVVYYRTYPHVQYLSSKSYRHIKIHLNELRAPSCPNMHC